MEAIFTKIQNDVDSKFLELIEEDVTVTDELYKAETKILEAQQFKNEIGEVGNQSISVDDVLKGIYDDIFEKLTSVEEPVEADVTTE